MRCVADLFRRRGRIYQANPDTTPHMNHPSTMKQLTVLFTKELPTPSHAMPAWYVRQKRAYRAKAQPKTDTLPGTNDAVSPPATLAALQPMPEPLELSRMLLEPDSATPVPP